MSLISPVFIVLKLWTMSLCVGDIGDIFNFSQYGLRSHYMCSFGLLTMHIRLIILGSRFNYDKSLTRFADLLSNLGSQMPHSR